MPLRFSRRILLLIGPVIAVLLGSSVLSLLALVEQAKQVKALTQHQWPLVDQLTLLTFHQNEQTLQLERGLHRIEGEAALDVASIRRGFAQRSNQIRAELQQAQRLLDDYERDAEALFGEIARLRAHLEQAQEHHAQLERQLDDILPHIEAGETAEADGRLASLMDTASALGEALRDGLLGIEEIVKEQAETAHRAERQAIFWSGFLIVLGIAASSLIIVWGIRSLIAAKDRERHFSALAAVGEFSAVVAHALRNPLAGIRAATQTVPRDGDSDDIAEVWASVRKEADRLEQRIASLLEFSRPFHPHRKEQDLRTVVETAGQVLADAAQQGGVEISLNLPKLPIFRRVDGEYLEDAILELVANALHAMPEGGKLELALRRRGRGVRLTVKDSGVGIPEAVRERVFELFFSTRVDGSGMGLVGVHKIVEAHGGCLSILETSPQGTVFAIDLP